MTEEAKKYDPNPASAANNRHHEGYYRDEQEWAEDLFGKGKYDVDMLPWYPGEQEATTKE